MAVRDSSRLLGVLCLFELTRSVPPPHCRELAPTTCECSGALDWHNATATERWRQSIHLPSCEPTAACYEISSMGQGAPENAIDTEEVSIVITYHHNSSSWFVKHWYMADPFRSYLNSMRLLFRLVLSLRRVGTRLPVHLLLSGERHPPLERWLVQHGVQLLEWEGPDYSQFDYRGSRERQKPPSPGRLRLPLWANRHHRGTFTKLQTLSLFQFRKVVVLDTDMVALHNIDHLAQAPTPGLSFRWDCRHREAHELRPTRAWELNSGVMVLRPSRAQFLRMLALVNNESSVAQLGIASDPSDQSIWRHFLPHVFELPQIYNAQKQANFSTWGWDQVLLLHDIDVHRGLRLPSSQVEVTIRNLTHEANRAVREVCNREGLQDRG